MYHLVLLNDMLHFLPLSSPHMVQTIVVKIFEPYYVSCLGYYHRLAPNLLQRFSSGLHPIGFTPFGATYAVTIVVIIHLVLI